MEERKKVSVIVDASREGSGGVPFDFSEFQDNFYDEPGGPYQTRKTSIVAGMSTDKLIDEHRKSISQLANDGAGVAIGELAGVTLSRRHTLSHEEYRDGLEAETFENLQSYEFGDE